MWVLIFFGAYRRQQGGAPTIWDPLSAQEAWGQIFGTRIFEGSLFRTCTPPPPGQRTRGATRVWPEG
jgi:hypothetical protein